ncbi:unnamed protein product [Schistocephalus solidus]|uniref:Maltoporin n=1 Tax=Schistocephalus solidus TaxID=70667 RepID=A0A183SSV4_SCHSO|nr:unnamed protein product [Schistocephalus solidus]
MDEGSYPLRHELVVLPVSIGNIDNGNGALTDRLQVERWTSAQQGREFEAKQADASAREYSGKKEPFEEATRCLKSPRPRWWKAMSSTSRICGDWRESATGRARTTGGVSVR